MTTVEFLHERYVGVIRSVRAPGTARAYRAAWAVRVCPTFGTRDIEDITTFEIEDAMHSWSGALSTRKDALYLMSAICKKAMKEGFIGINPCSGVELPRVPQRDPASRALNVEELERLFQALPSSGPYRRFVAALLFTGCRLGEIAGLRVSDVDWELGTIAVRRTASAGFNGELVIGPTKGRRVRFVPMAAPFVEVVTEASRGKEPLDLLFPGPRGGHISSKNLSRALKWETIRESIKRFPHGEPLLHWHDLRHTAAVVLFLAGLSIPDVQAILGHSSMVVTQLYANTRSEAAKRGNLALTGFYAVNSIGQSRGGEQAAKTASLLDF